MEQQTVDITQIILNTINSLLESLFSSIDNTIYSILDDITFLSPDILSSPYFKSIFGTSLSNGILLIANSLLLGFILYYAIQLLLSHFALTQTSRPLSFLFRLLFFTLCMNSSFFICEQILSFNSLLSSAIRELGENLFGCSICFSSLVEKLNTVIHIEENSLNIFSIDGLLKSILSISFLSLTFSYAVRYLLVKLFILLSPFSFLCLSLPSSSGFFRSWLKCFLGLLFVQILVALILLLIFSLPFHSTNMISKVLICASLFVLLKANSYLKEMLGGLSIEFSSNLSQLRSFFQIN